MSASSGSGESVSHVDFYWHSGDWLSSSWISLGSDWNEADGWSYAFDASPLADQRDIGFFVRAFDSAGNSSGAAIWNMAVDRTPPVSAISSLPDSLKSTAIGVKWSGSDNLAGIGHYELQLKKDSDAWQDWDTNIPGNLTETWVVVEKGHTYGFRLRAVDRMGNAEDYPSSAEQTVSIPTTICNAPDLYENDNSTSGASSTSGLVTVQEHNYCNPQAGSGDLNDHDWVKINLKANQRLNASVQPISGGAAAVLRLYAADGVTQLSQAQSPGFNQSAQLAYQATVNATAYLEITHLNSDVAGVDVRYKLIISNGIHRFLPLIVK